MSSTISKSLFVLSNNGMDNYKENKADLFNDLNQLLSYYQRKENLVLTEKKITCVLYILYLYSLKNFYPEKEEKTTLLRGQLSLTYIVSEYMKERALVVDLKQIDKEFEKKYDLINSYPFSLKSSSQGVNFNFVYFGYKLKGKIDSLMISYIDKIAGVNNDEDFVLADNMLHEFTTNLSSLSMSSDKVEELFLISLKENKQEDIFFKFIEDNFYLLLDEKNRKLKRKILKLLFYGINIYNNNVNRCVSYINKLVREDIDFESDVDKINFFTDKIDYHAFTDFKDKIISIIYLTAFGEDEYDYQQIDLIAIPNITDMINEIDSTIVYVKVKEGDKVIKNIVLLKNQEIKESIIKVSETELLRKNFEGLKEKYKTENVSVDIHNNNHIDHKDLRQMNRKLKEEGFVLFSEFDFKMKDDSLSYKLKKLKELPKGPLKNLTTLEETVKFIRKAVKEFSLNKITLNNIDSLFSFVSVKDRSIKSIYEIKENLLENKEEDRKSISSIISPNIINPIYLYVSSELLRTYPSITLISSDSIHNTNFSFKLLIRDFKGKDNFSNKGFNQLTSFLNDRLADSRSNVNFVVDIRENNGRKIDRLTKLFLDSLKDNLRVVFLKNYRKKNLKQIEEEINGKKMDFGSYTKRRFIPVYSDRQDEVKIFSFVENDCLTVQITKIDEDFKGKVNFSLKSYYRYLKKNGLVDDKLDLYISQDNSNNDSTVLYNIFDLTHNQFSCNLNSDCLIYYFSVLDKQSLEKVKIRYKNFREQFWKTNNFNLNYNQIKRFLNKLKKIKRTGMNLTEERILREFSNLLTTFSIDTFTDLKKLFLLKQIRKKKSIFQLFITMLKILEKNYNSQFGFSKKNIETLLSSFYLDKIVVLTPEYGEFMKVGGLAVMIEDLINEMLRFKEEFITIIPYYNVDKKKNENYLIKKGTKYLFNITVSLHNTNYEIGVHELKREGITFYFLHNVYLFPIIYQKVG